MGGGEGKLMRGEGRDMEGGNKGSKLELSWNVF